MVDLPCIIEAMKTLDYFNFYKSQDASQMLYVHPIKVSDLSKISKEKLDKKIADFDAINDDPEFFKQLYDRKGVLKAREKKDKKSKAKDCPLEEEKKF